MKKLLTIAGSDSSGGAGIQADLKTFAALFTYGMSAICALTAQNTQGVTMVVNTPEEMVEAQLDAIYSDIPPDGVKTGMLSTSGITKTVASYLEKHLASPLVVDPVMVATTGAVLLEKDAIEAYKTKLIPLATLITPNIPEAELLLGEKLESQRDLPLAAKKLARLQGQNVSVFLKAGHLKEDQLVDIFYNAETDQMIEMPSKRIFTKNTHGTGCTLSSAITAFLARGFSLDEAAVRGKEYIYQAILSGSKLEIGKGNGPVNHFWNVADWGNDQ